MALLLLRVLLLGGLAAAADDASVVWWWGTRPVQLPCVVPAADRLQLPARRSLPIDAPGDRRTPYTWAVDGDSVRGKISQNGSLEVQKRRRSGSVEGLYQCSVKTNDGVILGYPVTLKMSYIDKQFTQHPGNITAAAGQPVAISCNISSAPEAVYTWTRDGETLPDNDRYHLIRNHLLITDVQEEDAGTYRCTATNLRLNKQRTSNRGLLKVAPPAGDIHPRPLDVPVQTNWTVKRGSRVELACAVEGRPRPELLWELTPPGGRTGELDVTDQVLVIPNLELDQEGVYTCKIAGQPKVLRTFNITILEPVIITSGPESKEIHRAGTARFSCETGGRPAPTLTWFKDGEELELTGSRKLLKSATDGRMELVISGVATEDAGIYQCVASNTYSRASSWAVLSVPGEVPPPPTGVRCVPAGATSVLLSWEHSAPERVVAYTVHTTPALRISSGPIVTSESVVVLDEALQPYQMQVRAYLQGRRNATGGTASDMSAAVTCQGQGVPIKLSKLEDESYLVRWKEFASEHPGVVEWILQYREEGGPTTNLTLPGRQTNFTIEASPSLMYFRVLGTRSKPWLRQDLTLLPWTSSVDLEIPDPGDVVAVATDLEVVEVTSTTLTVRWRCAEADLTPEAYTFIVCVKLKNSLADNCQQSVKKSAIFDQLQPDSEYEVRVQALAAAAAARRGPLSDPITTRTLAADSEEQLEIVYAKLGPMTFRVWWSGGQARASDAQDKQTDSHNGDIVGHDGQIVGEDGQIVDEYGQIVGEDGQIVGEDGQMVGNGHDEQDQNEDIDEEDETNYGLDEQTEDQSGLTEKQNGHTRGEESTEGVGGVRGLVGVKVRYSRQLTLPLNAWTEAETGYFTALLTNLEPSVENYVMVTDESGHGRVLVIPAQDKDQGPEPSYTYSNDGVSISWPEHAKFPKTQVGAAVDRVIGGQVKNSKVFVVRYTQNELTPLFNWSTIAVATPNVELSGLNQSLPTFVYISPFPSAKKNFVLNIPPKSQGLPPLILGIAIVCGVILLVTLLAAALCIWRRRKRARSPVRRQRHGSGVEDNGDEGAELKEVGGRLANGGASRGAGEPLLNGHVRITENPTAPKTPNGKTRRPRQYEPFDVARYNDADVTLDTTVADTTTSSIPHLLDTSRAANHSHTSDTSLRLPDDNMNCELNRSKNYRPGGDSNFQPTLQPNG